MNRDYLWRGDRNDRIIALQAILMEACTIWCDDYYGLHMSVGGKNASQMVRCLRTEGLIKVVWSSSLAQPIRMRPVVSLTPKGMKYLQKLEG